MAPRTYNSPVREQQKAETRGRILDATVRVVLDEGVHAFTVQNVAKRAGISHRTVYRHFDSREALLEGLSEQLEQLGADLDVASLVQGDDALADAIRQSHDNFERQADVAQAVVISSIALRYALAPRARRTRTLADAMAERFPDVAPAVLHRAAHVLRHLIGSRTWFSLTREQGLGPDDAREGALHAARALLADLDRQQSIAAAQEHA